MSLGERERCLQLNMWCTTSSVIQTCLNALYTDFPFSRYPFPWTSHGPPLPSPDPSLPWTPFSGRPGHHKMSSELRISVLHFFLKESAQTRHNSTKNLTRFNKG